MNIGVRVIFGVAGVFLLLVGFFFVGLYLTLIDVSSTTLQQIVGQEEAGLTGGFLLLLGVIFTGIGVKQIGEKGEGTSGSAALVQFSENGEIRISYMAIESMVLRVAGQVTGVRDPDARVRFSEQGLLISLKIKTLPDIPLTILTTELQNRVNEYVKEITGAMVADTKIFVENIVADSINQESCS